MMEVEKSTKKIEIPTIKTEIEITEQWYNEIITGIADHEKKYGKKLTIGEYLEQSMSGMAYIIATQYEQINNLKAKELLPPEQNGAMYG